MYVYEHFHQKPDWNSPSGTAGEFKKVAWLVCAEAPAKLKRTVPLVFDLGLRIEVFKGCGFRL